MHLLKNKKTEPFESNRLLRRYNGLYHHLEKVIGLLSNNKTVKIKAPIIFKRYIPCLPHVLQTYIRPQDQSSFHNSRDLLFKKGYIELRG